MSLVIVTDGFYGLVPRLRPVPRGPEPRPRGWRGVWPPLTCDHCHQRATPLAMTSGRLLCAACKEEN